MLFRSLPFSSGSRESSEAFDWLECVRRVQAARDKMLARQGKLNGELSFKDVFREVKWAAGAKRLWNALELGFRGDTESLVGLGRLSLTISDLKGGHEVAEEDLFEARHYFAGFLESERGGSR